MNWTVLLSVRPLLLRLIVLLFASERILFAQTPDCRALVASPRNNNDYQLRTNSDRCEGFYASDVSKDGLVLTQLSFGSDPPDDPLVVNISVPRLSAPAHVSALSTSAHLYYRMDAPIFPNKPFRWPLSEVLLASTFAPESARSCGLERDSR